MPHSGNKLAYHANRTGVVARCSDPAGPNSVAVAVALSGSDDARRRDLAWHRVQAATQPDPQPLSRLPTVPGSGTILRRVLFDAIYALARCPSGQDVVSSGRLGQCAKASAGTRYGTAGPTSGQASLQGAGSAAAGLLLRDHRAGQTALARREKKPGQGTALTSLAPTRARAVYDMVQRGVVCAGDPWLRSSGRGVGEPVAALGHPGWSLEARAQS